MTEAVLALPNSRFNLANLKEHVRVLLSLQIKLFDPTCYNDSLIFQFSPSHFKSAPWSEIALRFRPILAPSKRL
jgi:hypothetical protein